MEKNGAVDIFASKEAPITIHAPVEASKAAVVPVQSPVPASAVVTGEEAPACRGQIPLDWDPYEKADYICLENAYDTSIVNPWLEVDSSDVCNDDESKHTKTHQVPMRLKSGRYDTYFTDDIYTCPFCNRRLGATNFKYLVTHAKDVSSCNPSAGHTMNVHSFRAKHKPLGFYLHNLQKMAIEEPKEPKVKVLGIKKWRKCQRGGKAKRCH